MIDKLYIPTYRRVDKQITFDGLPEKWQKKTVLLTDKQDTDALLKLGYPAVLCPAQGSLARVRNWIMAEAGDTKYGVLDDDLQEFLYTERPSTRENVRLVNSPISGSRLEPGYEDHFDVFMDWVDKTLDEVVTCGAQTTWIPPFEKDIDECWRQSGNHFYNGATLPKELIDYEAVHCAEDFYFILQLLTHGYKNRISHRWRVRPSNTADAGGCDEYRTIEKHNESMRELKDLFPEFVTLKEKIAKVGAWGGVPKLAANIQWKKAYKSSVKVNEFNLEDFFA